MDIQSSVLLIAILLVVISVIQPLAGLLRLPPSVLLALVGLAVGLVATALLAAHPDDRIGAWSLLIVDLPLGSSLFLYVFLPVLLFQSSLECDVRRMAEDTVPIFVLAVLAVLVATFVIGLALWPLSGLPLIACLLLASIVATTDPSAVLSLFRDLGVPQRLIRLVEGESLLNDAVAITLFVLFAEALILSRPLGTPSVALDFIIVALGGAVAGYSAARLLARGLTVFRDNQHVQVSLSVATPFLVYIGADRLGLSGVMAVVVAGLTMSGYGPTRLTPSAWRYLRDSWGQLGFWAESLVFVIAAILVPRLLRDLHWWDLLLVLVVVAMALVARVAILFGLLPLLARLRVSPPVSPRFRVMLLWGGLRGAATLALALAVTEDPNLDEGVKRFVAIVATSFVLFTLLVQGPTLRPLMRALGLNRLSPFDTALREQALIVAHRDVADAVEAAAGRFDLSREATHAVVAAYAPAPAADQEAETPIASLALSDRLRLGLAALAAREREIVLQLFDERTVSGRIVDSLTAEARRLLDGTRAAAVAGYRRAAADSLGFDWRIRLAKTLHLRFGDERLLNRHLADRFETLLVKRIILQSLPAFLTRKIEPVLGANVAMRLQSVIEERQLDTTRALDALRLQYPDYADALERQFLLRTALRHEEREYDLLYEQGLVGPEIKRELMQRVAEQRRQAERRPKLDLGLGRRALAAAFPLFNDLDEGELSAICRLLRPRLAIPGERLVKRGERGDAVFFISSGAVEIDTGRTTVMLGSGDFFGELALLRGVPRQADVTAAGYCSLMVLYANDFRSLLERNPAMQRHIEAVAEERLRRNAAAAGEV